MYGLVDRRSTGLLPICINLHFIVYSILLLIMSYLINYQSIEEPLGLDTNITH